MAKWRESAPLGPAAAPPRPGVGCEGSAPLARPWAPVGVRGPRGRPPRAREGRPPSLYPLIHVASLVAPKCPSDLKLPPTPAYEPADRGKPHAKTVLKPTDSMRDAP